MANNSVDTHQWNKFENFIFIIATWCPWAIELRDYICYRTSTFIYIIVDQIYASRELVNPAPLTIESSG